MRTDDHALAFVIWGCAYQIMRLLSLDLSPPEGHRELEATINPIEKESQKRLLWSCFILDSFIGSGIDENLRWRGDVPAVSLPCSDHEFLEQRRPHTQGRLYLKDLNSPSIFENFDLRSHMIYLSSMRTQVLR